MSTKIIDSSPSKENFKLASSDLSQINIKMKEWFFAMLKRTDFYYKFLSEFGDKNTEESCCAEYDHLEGWSFGDDYISYRAEDLFDCYEDGYNWRFADDGFEWVIKQLLLSHGFEVEFEGGDEEDGLFLMRKEVDMSQIKPAS